MRRFSSGGAYFYFLSGGDIITRQHLHDAGALSQFAIWPKDDGYYAAEWNGSLWEVMRLEPFACEDDAFNYAYDIFSVQLKADAINNQYLSRQMEYMDKVQAKIIHLSESQ